jgi:hypothetical protein
METWRGNYPVSVAVASPLVTLDSGLLHAGRPPTSARDPPHPGQTRSVTPGRPVATVLRRPRQDLSYLSYLAHEKGEAMREHRPPSRTRG